LDANTYFSRTHSRTSVSLTSTSTQIARNKVTYDCQLRTSSESGNGPSFWPVAKSKSSFLLSEVDIGTKVPVDGWVRLINYFGVGHTDRPAKINTPRTLFINLAPKRARCLQRLKNSNPRTKITIELTMSLRNGGSLFVNTIVKKQLNEQ
jgi:hypothetical protein